MNRSETEIKRNLERTDVHRALNNQAGKVWITKSYSLFTILNVYKLI